MRVCYVTVYVRDLDRAVEFYEITVGMPLAFSDANFGWASFNLDGTQLTIQRVDRGDADSAQLVGRTKGVALGVSDVQAAHDELTGKGVTFSQPPKRQPWGATVATFADPEGNLIRLHEEQPDG